MPEVEFPANGATATGYLAEPDGEGPGVVVLQEWWGVDDHIRDVCDRFAQEGFVALAPDLFHGETTDQPDEAQQKMMALNMEEAEKEMRGAVSSFYYVMPHGKPDFSRIQAPVLGHFGTADDFISVDDAKALEQELRDAGVDAQFEFYDGAGHAFFADHDRLGTHDPNHAQSAWRRTIDFFKRHLTRS